MDPETEMLQINEELEFVDSMIEALKELKKRKGYKDCLEDTINLIDKLKDRKKRLKKAADDLTEEIIAISEVYEDLDFKALDAEVY